MSNIVIPDGGTIGSTSDTDAIAISSGGNVTLSQTLDGGAIGSAVTMSANQACVKTALNATGDAPIYACRAWVNFNGTSSPTINASGNVTGVTYNSSAGQFFITTGTISTDAVIVVTAGDNTNFINRQINATAKQTSTTQFYIACWDTVTTSGFNPDIVNVAIFR
jgi:hypothetical protein